MFLTFLLTLLLAYGSPFSSATMQATGNTIAGHVMDSSRRPLADIYVELFDDVETRLGRVKTDGGGRYVFSRLQPGTFHVRVVTVGTNFVSQTARVELIVVSAAPGSGRAYEEQSFTLKTVDEAKSPQKTGSSGTVFSQNVPAESQKLYEGALEKLTSGGVSEGIDGLKQAIDSFPNYYLALERLGMEYVKQSQHTQAQETLNKAIKVNPKGQMSLHSLGVAQYNLKNLPGAIESLQRAVALAPSSVNSQFWLGIVLFRSGKINEAEAPLKRAYELGGKQVADVHMYLAQIYSNTKRYKEGADELELFLKETDAKDSERIKELIQQLRNKANQ